jgi:hypothetical protein
MLRLAPEELSMHVALLVIAALLALLAPQPSKPTTTEQLVQAMQARYKESWYRTATFVQKTTNYAPDGTKTVATWYEAIAVPGKLRIDFTPVSEGNGIIFADDVAHSFRNGKDTPRPQIHPLILLGFDVYLLPPDKIMEKLKTLRFDTSVFHEDTWEGRPVYVVGAPAGDVKTAQFWIDAERLYFVRMIRPSGPDGSRTQETQFNKYERLGGGWMAPEVIFKTDGRVVTTEEYSDLQSGMTFDPKLFDPESFTTVHWRQ